MTSGSPAHASDAAAVATARHIALGLAGGLVLLVLLLAFMAPRQANPVLVVPAAILGIVSPAIGYRLYLLKRDRLPPDATPPVRRADYLNATVVGLAVTEGAALLGSVAYMLSGELPSLIGVVSHAILTGALWPTEEKLEAFAAVGESQ